MFDYLTFDIFLTTWHFDTFNLNHLSPHRAIFQLVAPSVERFELFFSKMVKLEGKESPDSKLSDFEWFGEVFKIIMFNMFVWFCHIFLISDLNTCPILMYDHANRSSWPPLQEYEVILPPVGL